jgi:hypothetical protein
MHLQSVSTIFISFAFLCINQVVASTEGTVHLNCQGIKHDGLGNSQPASAGYAIQTSTVDGYLQSRILAEGRTFKFYDCSRGALEYECAVRDEFGDSRVYHSISFNRSSGSVDEFKLVEPQSSVLKGFTFEGQCEVSDEPKF